jgi:hypothetical protein
MTNTAVLPGRHDLLSQLSGIVVRLFNLITAVAVRCFVTVLAIGALIYAFPIFGLGSPAPAGLRCSDSILVFF